MRGTISSSNDWLSSHQFNFTRKGPHCFNNDCPINPLRPIFINFKVIDGRSSLPLFLIYAHILVKHLEICVGGWFSPSSATVTQMESTIGWHKVSSSTPSTFWEVITGAFLSMFAACCWQSFWHSWREHTAALLDIVMIPYVHQEKYSYSKTCDSYVALLYAYYYAFEMPVPGTTCWTRKKIDWLACVEKQKNALERHCLLSCRQNAGLKD